MGSTQAGWALTPLRWLTFPEQRSGKMCRGRARLPTDWSQLKLRIYLTKSFDTNPNDDLHCLRIASTHGLQKQKSWIVTQGRGFVKNTHSVMDSSLARLLRRHLVRGLRVWTSSGSCQNTCGCQRTQPPRKCVPNGTIIRVQLSRRQCGASGTLYSALAPPALRMVSSPCCFVGANFNSVCDTDFYSSALYNKRTPTFGLTRNRTTERRRFVSSKTFCSEFWSTCSWQPRELTAMKETPP